MPDAPTGADEPSLATSVCGLSLSSCLFNSSNPFATNLDDLQKLEASAAGAIATRTACPGFVHDDATMKWATPDKANTINCLGYSPNTFEYYCENVQKLTDGKPIWMSISGYAEQVAGMIETAGALASRQCYAPLKRKRRAARSGAPGRATLARATRACGAT